MAVCGLISSRPEARFSHLDPGPTLGISSLSLSRSLSSMDFSELDMKPTDRKTFSNKNKLTHK